MKDLSQTILESIATGVVTFDAVGRLTSVNRAGAEMFGFDPQKDLGKKLSTLLGSESNRHIYSLAATLLRTRRKKTEYDVRFVRKDGVSFSLNMIASTLPNGDCSGGGLFVFENITQEQRFATTLCRYLAREVADQILHNGYKPTLGGHRTEVTILI